MNLSPEILQYITWLLSLLQFVLALYVLVLNPWHTANRHVSSLALFFAINSFAVGLLISARDAAQATLPTLLLAATTPVAGSFITLVAVALLKPGWLSGRWRSVWWVIYILLFLPIVITAVDAAFGTRLWYSGLDATTYAGGYVDGSEYWNGSFSLPIRVLGIFAQPLFRIVFLLYVALIDKKATQSMRRWAWLLLAVDTAINVSQVWLRTMVGGVPSILATNTVFVFAYAYAIFQQMISERQAQRGRLQFRLTALILAVTVPLLVAVALFVGDRAGAVVEKEAEEKLEAANRALTANVSVWLDFNVKALQQLVSLPDIISMDPERQKPNLDAMAAAYPHMYLVSTTDLNGVNMARNDDVAPKDYSDRPWFLKAREGASLTFQTLVGRTSGEPALVASMPIRDESGAIVGVGMFASDLTDIAHEVEVSKVGNTGIAYVVDAQNRVVAHPDPAFSSELQDLSAYPPVLALRQGAGGALTFLDEEGQRWLAHMDVLNNGWGVVVQQQADETLLALGSLRQLSWVVVAAGASLLLVLTWLTVRQVLLPIHSLTETATAIAAGDLARIAPMESEDEIGTLARAFNSMTGQLRGLIGGLEDTVAERTAELERRASQLQTAAEVGRVATSALDEDELLEQVVALIGERFGYYHTSIFLLDETRRWVEYRAGTGEVGHLIRSQGLRFEVGGASTVGWCAAYVQPRVTQDVSQDALYQAYPLLSETCSEATLPLIARGRLIGVLDVQDAGVNAFSQEVVAALQIVADQIAVAIDNVRLLTEVREGLDEAQAVHRHYLQEAWADFATTRRSAAGYRYVAGDVESVSGTWLPAMADAQQHNRVVVSSGDDGATTLSLPITLRGEPIGVLGLKKDDEGGWTDDDIAVAQAVVDQVALSLENVRLFEEAQRRAGHEALVRELAEKMRRSNEVDAILETAVEGLGRVLGSARAFVRLQVPSIELD